jgi:LPXTG-site transpeptidase (sortase) family protein
MFSVRSRSHSVQRALGVAVVVFVLAMMVMPMVSPSGASAADDDSTIKFNGKVNISDVVDDPEATPDIPIFVQEESDPEEDAPDVDPTQPEGEGEDPDAGDPEPTINPEQTEEPGVEETEEPGGDPIIDLPCVTKQDDSGIHLSSNQILDFDAATGVITVKTNDLFDVSGINGVQDLIVQDDGGMPETVKVRLPGDFEIDVNGDIDLKIPDCDDEESEPGYVTVHKYICPVELAMPDSDLDTLRDGCESLPGVYFNLNNANAQGDTQDSATTDADGLAIWSVTDPESLTISESLPALHSPDVIVYCGVIEGAGQFPNTLSPVAAVDASIGYELGAGEQLYCDWFNQMLDFSDEDYNGIVITKHPCPLGFDAYNSDADGLAANCDEYQNGVTFTATDGGPVTESATTGTGGAGRAIISGLDSGEYFISEEIPAGYGQPVVYCGMTGALEGEPEDYAGMDLSGDGEIFSVLANDETLWCQWFNVPNGEPTDVVVEIAKYNCPIGFDPYNASHYDLAYNCQEQVDGVEFGISDGGSYVEQQTTGDVAPGGVVFEGLAPGPYSIVEQVPDGFEVPVVFCDSFDAGGNSPDGSFQATVLDGNQIFQVLEPGLFFCDWYNVPAGYDDAGDGGDVVIYKFECPIVPDLSNFDYDSTPEGCVPLPGIEFTLSYGIDTILTEVTSDLEASVGFYGLPGVTVSISEALPDGYGQPVVTCLSVYDGIKNDLTPNLTGAAFAYDLKEGEHLQCFWLNIPTEDGSITIVKYFCEAGYDLQAYGANPEYDCSELGNGIDYSLTDQYGDSVTATTGTSGPGTLTWDSLPAGHYAVSEQVPSGTDYVFVLSCQSERAQWIQGNPLSYGSDFDFDLLSGDHVTCYWYNVPEQDHTGTITVVKYACPTEIFHDADDCEIYENGASFSLSIWTGNNWSEFADGTTDGYGLLSWVGLEPGTYELDEVGTKWCYASADRTDSDGNLVVATGKETTVWVYNCGKKAPTKKPTKFPNTGVGQSAVEPALTEATGANAPVAPVGGAALRNPLWYMAVVDNRLVSYPPSSAKPATLRIDDIELNASVETLEIVDGKLQDPTTADKVAWYKDTAKLGEPGNIVIAGHLNYWGVPEGVFYRLNTLEKGTIIEVVSQTGEVTRYRVDWVKEIDAIDGDVAELVGETKTRSLTLITCGGEWNDAIGEYDHRTVVRASLVIEIDL